MKAVVVVTEKGEHGFTVLEIFCIRQGNISRVRQKLENKNGEQRIFEEEF